MFGARRLFGAPEERPTPPPALVFEEVFEQQLQFVWSNLRRLGVEPAQLDDATQDVFVAVHRRLGAFVGGSMRAWLFQFVVRVAATHRRTAHNANKLKGAEALQPERTSGVDNSPAEQLEAKQHRDLLYRLLGELTEERRAIFVLAELEELPMPEVAEALKLNLNTAYSRLREARRDLTEAALRERAKETWRHR